MKEVTLICTTLEGTQEIPLEVEKLSFGRGGNADVRFDDEGLSRLNSTIYREDDDVWIVDENSTNGTFVNGEEVYPNGMPLKNGDSIKIGNYTNIKVRIGEKQTVQPESVSVAPSPSDGKSNSVSVSTTSASGSSSSFTSLLPIIITAVAIFVISISAVFIVITASGINDKPVVKNSPTPDDTDDPDDPDDPKPKNSPTPKPSATTDKPEISTPSIDNTSITNSPKIEQQPTPVNLPSKKYTDMSETEKKQYVQVKAEKVASLIGNRGDNSITQMAVERIKGFLDAYVTRIKVKPFTGKCHFGDNLEATYKRASLNAPFIIKSFNNRGLDPQIGLYLR